MLTDTHTHLYLPEFDADNLGVDAVNRAIEAGVERMIFPNVDLGTIEPMKRLHSLFPDNTRMAMGFHPTEVNDGWADSLDVVRRELDSAPGAYVAVGEIGIDLYWDKTFEREQMLAFEQQVGWAVERGLPVIVHCREGLDRVLEVLQEFPSARGVMHSFGGEAADVDRVKRTVDFYFGINGIVTSKNSRLRDTLPAIGTDRLLLETDSPYLAPVPNRGRRNESAFLVRVASHVAGSLGMTTDEIAGITSRNAAALFGL